MHVMEVTRLIWLYLMDFLRISYKWHEQSRKY